MGRLYLPREKLWTSASCGKQGTDVQTLGWAAFLRSALSPIWAKGCY